MAAVDQHPAVAVVLCAKHVGHAQRAVDSNEPRLGVLRGKDQPDGVLWQRALQRHQQDLPVGLEDGQVDVVVVRDEVAVAVDA
jgi:hypothetical protein